MVGIVIGELEGDIVGVMVGPSVGPFVGDEVWTERELVGGCGGELLGDFVCKWVSTVVGGTAGVPVVELAGILDGMVSISFGVIVG